MQYEFKHYKDRPYALGDVKNNIIEKLMKLI